MTARWLGVLAGWLAAAGFVAAQEVAVGLGRPIVLNAPFVRPAASRSIPTSAVVMGAPIADTAVRAPVYRAAMDPLTGPVPIAGASPVPPPPGTVAPVAPPPLPPPPPLGQPLGAPTVPSAPSSSRVWLNAEYLMWWVKSGPAPLPPSFINVPAGFDFSGSTSLGGAAAAGSFNYGVFSGIRITGGGWLTPDELFGLEGSFLLLERRSASRTAIASTNGLAGFGVPPALAGIRVNSNTQLYGFEANGLFSIAHDCSSHLELIGGFRNLNLEENLSIGGASTTTITGIPATAAFADSFRTQSYFYGPQLGLRGGIRFGKFSTDGTLKLAMGVTHEIVTINGARVASFNGVTGTALGGMYAEPTNIGRQTHDQFAVLPEATIRIGYNFTPNLKVFVGYTFLYLSSVARPGQQVDPVINATQIIGPFNGPVRPAPFYHDGSFWAQGVNLGMELTY